jgi:hypothetical protein
VARPQWPGGAHPTGILHLRKSGANFTGQSRTLRKSVFGRLLVDSFFFHFLFGNTQEAITTCLVDFTVDPIGFSDRNGGGDANIAFDPPPDHLEACREIRVFFWGFAAFPGNVRVRKVKPLIL